MSKKNRKKVLVESKVDLENISLPQVFLQNFEKDFGKEDAEKYKLEFEKSPVRGIRFLSFKASPQLAIEKSGLNLESIPYFVNAFYLLSDDKMGNTILHQSGAIYLQEPSSMVPVASVKNFDFANKLVLDLCASPGGKTTQIASLMNGSGELLSNEIDTRRAKVLYSNVERLGIKNVVVANETPQNLAKKFSGIFDYIFVDAPCSGEGMFRKDKQAIVEWNENLKFYNKDRQLEILQSANKMLVDGGIIVYSTCTFNLVENESVVNDFAKNYNYEILPLDHSITNVTLSGKVIDNNINLQKTAHFVPYMAQGEGQFVAVLKKSGQNNNLLKKPQNLHPKFNDMNIIKEFFAQNLVANCYENFDFLINKEKICVLEKQNNLLCVDDVNTLTKGVILGEIIKNRLEIHHQFFSAYGKLFKNYVNLKFDSELLKKYVLGVELDLDEICSSADLIGEKNQANGYGVIMADGYSLGGYKLVDGKLKNHYPKALRINKI